jgi:hypothetical protein
VSTLASLQRRTCQPFLPSLQKIQACPFKRALQKKSITGHMSGADNNVEKLTGRRSMTVGEFARAHLDKLNLKKS